MDYSQLSDDELLQMAGEKGISKEQNTNELSNLSDEELMQLASQKEILPGQEAVSQKPKVRQLESLVRGTAQGFSFGYADEITSAIESFMTEKSYDQALTESRRAYKVAEEANPYTYKVGEIGGAITSGVAAMAAAPITGTAATIAAGVTMGAISGAGYSDAKLGVETVKDAAAGAALAFAGDMVVRGSGKALKAIFGRSTAAGKEVLGDIATEVAENTKVRAATMGDMITGKYDTFESYALSNKAMDNATKQVGEIPEILAKVVNDEKSMLGAALNAAKDQVGDVRVNAGTEFKVFTEEVSKLRSSLLMDEQAGEYLQKNIIDKFKKGVTIGEETVNLQNMNVEQAHKVKQLINRLVDSQENSPMFKSSPEATTSLRKFANSLTDKFNSPEIDPSGTIANINKRFAKVYDLADVLPKNAEEAKSIISSMATSASAEKGAKLISTAHGYDPAIAQKIYDIVNPRLKFYSAVNTVRSMNMGVSEYFRFSAGMAVAGPIGGIAALGKSGVMLGANIVGRSATIVSRAARDAFKIPRNVGGIMQNADMIVSKISAISPAFAIQAQKIFDKGDPQEVQQMVEMGLQDPELAAEFEPGMGFEGKAITPEEKQQVEMGIKSQGLSISQQRQMLQKFRGDSMIPTPQEVPPSGRFFSTYKAKARNNGRKKIQF